MMQSAATELQSVEATLDAVLYDGTNNATALAAEINAATQNITVTPFPPSTLTALNNSQVDSASHTIQFQTQKEQYGRGTSLLGSLCFPLHRPRGI